MRKAQPPVRNFTSSSHIELYNNWNTTSGRIFEAGSGSSSQFFFTQRVSNYPLVSGGKTRVPGGKSWLQSRKWENVLR